MILKGDVFNTNRTGGGGGGGRGGVGGAQVFGVMHNWK